ncbi:MAG: glycosyl hydrolase [Mangrovibacterium sp.]
MTGQKTAKRLTDMLRKWLYFTAAGTVLLLPACGTSWKTAIPEHADPEADAKPWVFWYWMHGAVTEKAVSADLEAMKEAGLGGAYLFSIKDVTNPPLYEPSVRTMTPEWWRLVKHAMSEADRLGLKLGMNACDGFTCAGGPWITPEKSMQKVVWVDTIVSGNQLFNDQLPQPQVNEKYYEDLAVYAFPAPEGSGETSFRTKPAVSTSKGDDARFLAEKGNKKQYKSSDPCWIRYAFEKPFTCRSVTIGTGWNNYQSNRLILEVSHDGLHFSRHERLQPPRSGWEDLDANATHLIRPVTARYFRFVYDPDGSEPGAEDLDDAKWAPALKIQGIELSGEARIHQYEGKSAAIWRIAKRTANDQLTARDGVDPSRLKDISKNMLPDGTLKWQIPEGKWKILRIGHTSTGKTNYVGGGGMGLECDKLNPEVVKFQFDQWFGEAFRQIGPDLAGRVLKRFHVDSWECGSQNWSPVLREEFLKRRGYDLYPWLPVMAGVPIRNAEISERFLYDLRQTISELVTDNFYQTLALLAHEKNCLFSAESISPVMPADGMAYFREVDLPMGEFWFRSPSHDKLNDMLDAVSGGHIYGKRIIQAEGLTGIRLDWDEHPGMLKPVVDRNFALGMNKLMIHVFTLNPWEDRKPGMTLDKVGIYFQRDQTWWKTGRAFTEYLTNCQRLLQRGIPVTDVAVFTGEEIPRRAVLPDRLTGILPGLIGKERVDQEKIRLRNERIPLRSLPEGVRTQENMADPEEWVDPLNGYAYDSFNRDALLNLARVENGKVIFPGGVEYALLVIPGARKMAPDGGERMSVEVAQKLLELVNAGARILLMEKPSKIPGLQDQEREKKLQSFAAELFSGEKVWLTESLMAWKKGKGMVIQGPYTEGSLDLIGLKRDFQVIGHEGKSAGEAAWNHRLDEDTDIYFVSNQEDKIRTLEMTFRVAGKSPEIYDPVTHETRACRSWKEKDGVIRLSYTFHPNESCFFLFRKTDRQPFAEQPNRTEPVPVMDLEGEWTVRFDPVAGGPEDPVVFPCLSDWSKHGDERIRFYSGTAEYVKTFLWDSEPTQEKDLWLELGSFGNMAEVILNGKPCGTCWTAPFRLKIGQVVRKGENELKIFVTNTWANRIRGDHDQPEEKRTTWTTAPYRLEGRELLPAGLFGPVRISESEHQEESPEK